MGFEDFISKEDAHEKAVTEAKKRAKDISRVGAEIFSLPGIKEGSTKQEHFSERHGVDAITYTSPFVNIGVSRQLAVARKERVADGSEIMYSLVVKTQRGDLVYASIEPGNPILPVVNYESHQGSPRSFGVGNESEDQETMRLFQQIQSELVKIYSK